MKPQPYTKPVLKQVSSHTHALFAKIFRKRSPLRLEDLPDHQLLTVLLGSSEAASSVLTVIGDLGSFSRLAELGGSRVLMGHPGMGEAALVKLEAVFEFACRVG